MPRPPEQSPIPEAAQPQRYGLPRAIPDLGRVISNSPATVMNGSNNTASIDDYRAGRRPVDFFIWDLAVLGGMEKALVELASELSHGREVRLVAGKASSSSAAMLAQDGHRLEVGRLSLLSRWLFASSDRTTVIVGVWTLSRLVLRPRRQSKVIYWEHSCTPERLASDRRLRTLYRASRRAIRALPVVVPSKSCRDGAALVGVSRASIEVIPNIWRDPPDPAMPRTAPQQGRIRLGFMARLVDVKRPHLALAAMTHLPAQYVLTIHGAGPERGRLESLRADLNLEDRVDIAGWTSDPLGALRTVDVLLSTSLSETFGFTLLEAASEGVPVVATAGGAVSDLVGIYCPGAVAQGAEPAQIARAVEWIIANPPTKQAWENAREARLSLGPLAVREAWERLLDA